MRCAGASAARGPTVNLEDWLPSAPQYVTDPVEYAPMFQVLQQGMETLSKCIKAIYGTLGLQPTHHCVIYTSEMSLSEGVITSITPADCDWYVLDCAEVAARRRRTKRRRRRGKENTEEADQGACQHSAQCQSEQFYCDTCVT